MEIHQLKNKRIYSVVLNGIDSRDNRGANMLWMGLARTLQEAIGRAKESSKIDGIIADDWKMSAYTVRDVGTLLLEIATEEIKIKVNKEPIKKETRKNKRNIIIKEIILKKDKKLINTYKNKLNKCDIEYLKDYFKKKK